MASQDNMCAYKVTKLSTTQNEIIQNLVYFQDKFENPPSEEVEKITVSLFNL